MRAQFLHNLYSRAKDRGGEISNARAHTRKYTDTHPWSFAHTHRHTDTHTYARAFVFFATHANIHTPLVFCPYQGLSNRLRVEGRETPETRARVYVRVRVRVRVCVERSLPMCACACCSLLTLFTTTIGETHGVV